MSGILVQKRKMQAKTKEYKSSLLEREAQPTDTKPKDLVHVLTWEEFLEDFHKAFKPVNQGTDAHLKIKSLRQKQETY
uniref:Retrotransposon gag domain-containing protein n=1 Tax=Moniliophthora roreri TaxID=221103 RepID=A0A0W0GBK3_MONRR